MHKFVYLKYGLALVLVFVGIKMLMKDVYHMPGLLSLGVVLSILVGAAVASLIVARMRGDHKEGPESEEAKSSTSTPPIDASSLTTSVLTDGGKQ